MIVQGQVLIKDHGLDFFQIFKYLYNSQNLTNNPFINVEASDESKKRTLNFLIKSSLEKEKVKLDNLIYGDKKVYYLEVLISHSHRLLLGPFQKE